MKSPANWFFIQQRVQASYKEHIKSMQYWLFLGESMGHQWIPFTSQSASNGESVSVIMVMY